MQELGPGEQDRLAMTHNIYNLIAYINLQQKQQINSYMRNIIKCKLTISGLGSFQRVTRDSC